MPRPASMSAKRLVDLVERAAVGDEPLEVELARPPEVDHPGHVAQRVAAAEEAALELLLLDAEQHRGRDRDRLVGTGAPTSTVMPPGRVAAIPTWASAVMPAHSNA